MEAVKTFLIVMSFVGVAFAIYRLRAMNRSEQRLRDEVLGLLTVIRGDLAHRQTLTAAPPAPPAGMAPVSADDIPDGIVHDDMRDQLRRLARKWGAPPRTVLRVAVALQVVKAWKEEVEDVAPESGEMHLNVSTAVDDTAEMFEPGYAEEIGVAPPSLREGAANDAGDAGQEDETLCMEGGEAAQRTTPTLISEVTPPSRRKG